MDKNHERDGSFGSAVSVLSSLRKKRQSVPKDLVLGTLIRFKQLKERKLVSEIMEWLTSQHWWDFSHLDFNMLMLAYGKRGNFERSESALESMKKNGVPIDVAAYTALIEAYGKAGHSNDAYPLFKGIQLSGPEPFVATYQTLMNCRIDVLRNGTVKWMERELNMDVKIHCSTKPWGFHKDRWILWKMAKGGQQILSWVSGTDKFFNLTVEQGNRKDSVPPKKLLKDLHETINGILEETLDLTTSPFPYRKRNANGALTSPSSRATASSHHLRPRTADANPQQVLPR